MPFDERRDEEVRLLIQHVRTGWPGSLDRALQMIREDEQQSIRGDDGTISVRDTLTQIQRLTHAAMLALDNEQERDLADAITAIHDRSTGLFHLVRWW